jgi:hypothetical protein
MYGVGNLITWTPTRRKLHEERREKGEETTNRKWERNTFADLGLAIVGHSVINGRASAIRRICFV